MRIEWGITREELKNKFADVMHPKFTRTSFIYLAACLMAAGATTIESKNFLFPAEIRIPVLIFVGALSGALFISDVMSSVYDYMKQHKK